jgi:hypothetical protein
MGTHPLGRGTKNLSVNVPASMRAALERLAAASGMTLSQYIRLVLTKAVSTRQAYELRETSTPHVSSAGSDPSAARDPHSDSVLNDTLSPHLGTARKPKRGS